MKCVKDLDALFSARLTLIQRYFPDYTDHGITHSNRVLEYFAELLEKRDILNQLSEEQAFVCICACLMHDIGMGPISEEELKEAKYYGLHVCLTDNSVAYCESVEQNNQYCNFIMNYEQHRFYCKNSFVPIETYTSMHGITEADVLNAFYMDVTHQPTMSNQPKTDKNAMKYKGSKR